MSPKPNTPPQTIARVLVYFLPHPNLGSLISGSCFNPSAMPLPSCCTPSAKPAPAPCGSFAIALPAFCAMCAAGLRRHAFPWQRRRRCLARLSLSRCRCLGRRARLGSRRSAGFAGIVYGLACGLDPGRSALDLQMDMPELQCIGECIEIAGDALDVGDGMR